MVDYIYRELKNVARVTLLVNALFLFAALEVNAQVDTLAVYDVHSTQVNFIAPSVFDTTVAFDNTDAEPGAFPGFTQLETTPPAITPPNSGFTDLLPTHGLFNRRDYPIRTAVKLFKYESDTLAHLCTGLMVSEGLVLTSAHCLAFNLDTTGVRIFVDSVRAMPAFDNGIEDQQFKSSVSTKYYLPKSWYDGSGVDDIALIALDKPLGLQTGWIGIAFSEDTSFFQNSVFHKLSYPAAVDPSDPTRIFNGDTLYYNYGTLDEINDRFLGFNLTGITGQSGSPLIYTDNSVYYTLGVLNWAFRSRHYRINRGMFYALKSIVDDISTGLDEPEDMLPEAFSISQNYPNPFNPATRFDVAVATDSDVEIAVYNIVGQRVAWLQRGSLGAGHYTYEWQGETSVGVPAASGIYFIRMTAANYTKHIKAILLR
ncbi:MAG: trypsin-like serine protease [Calditrichia bacterium]